MMKQVIEKYSAKYNIPPGLIRAIIEIESSGYPFAIRYEKKYKWLYKPEQFGINRDTEIAAQKTSWGLMQVMGAVARQLGFNGLFLSELLQKELGIKYGCMHLNNLYNRYIIDNKATWEKAIVSYNAGSPRKDENGKYVNQSYLDKVLKKWD